MTGGEIAGSAGKVAAPLVKPVGLWLLRRVRPDTSLPALYGLADGLAGAVRRRESVRLEQLRGGTDRSVELGFEDVSVFRADDGGTQAYTVANIGTFFRQQAPQQRLVILGESGAGKTVLAIRLLLDQLDYRDGLEGTRRYNTPVAVRVSVAGWDGTSDVSDWLTARASPPRPPAS